MRAWLSMIRPMSSLLTILLVSLLWCIKVDTLGTLYKEDLDWTHHHFDYFYITDDLYFNLLISFWYPYFFLLLMTSLACDWGLSLSFTLACHSKNLFCPFQQGVEGIVERLGKLEKEIEERIEEDNMLKSKTTWDHCLSLQPIKRLESHLLCRGEFQE